ncbi:MAG: hypothetical protein KKE05_04955, partial [Nanoarchaeota archaeon]|nr:hypothetical protein [Nanoarchaeota archaeon]
MKKLAKEIKKGDKLKLAGKIFTVEEIEISDVGKQGTKKCRIVAKPETGDKMVLIRP